MAGDWIPMRLDLDEDPAIATMAEMLEMDIWGVIGRCWRVWCWASRNCNAESVTHVTLKRITSVTHVELRFLESLVFVGWLEVIEVDGIPGVRFPHFERWLSQSAKTRALTRRRVEKYRTADGGAQVKRLCNAQSVTTEEKRREEKRSKKKTPLPPFDPLENLPFDNADFLDAWETFVKHRKEIKKPLTPTATKQTLQKLASWGVARAVGALRHTTAMGWQGIREPEQNGRSNSSADIDAITARVEQRKATQ